MPDPWQCSEYRSCYRRLVRSMEPLEVRGNCYSAKLISTIEMEGLMKLDDSRSQHNEQLLQMLAAGGAATFLGLRTVLGKIDSLIVGRIVEELDKIDVILSPQVKRSVEEQADSGHVLHKFDVDATSDMRLSAVKNFGKLCKALEMRLSVATVAELKRCIVMDCQGRDTNWAAILEGYEKRHHHAGVEGALRYWMSQKAPDECTSRRLCELLAEISVSEAQDCQSVFQTQLGEECDKVKSQLVSANDTSSQQEAVLPQELDKHRTMLETERKVQLLQSRLPTETFGKESVEQQKSKVAEADQQNTLQSLLPLFMRTVKPEALCNDLLADGIITHDDWVDLADKSKTQKERAHILYDAVRGGGETAFDCLVGALLKSHLRPHEELAKKLKGKLEEVLAKT